ncbi:hypothetical protein VNI00_012135 [Paramarasmius palmivorus]|uniref:Uncharacterized protein n=1 Tax=Paramarasmius palmivorus TaxID=297713 RepID=A0AAW0C8I3_9AGAR
MPATSHLSDAPANEVPTYNGITISIIVTISCLTAVFLVYVVIVRRRWDARIARDGLAQDAKPEEATRKVVEQPETPVVPIPLAAYFPHANRQVEKQKREVKVLAVEDTCKRSSTTSSIWGGDYKPTRF